MKTQTVLSLFTGLCIGSILTIIIDESDTAKEKKEHNSRMRDVEYYHALTRLEGSIEVQEIYEWSQKEKSKTKFHPLNHKK
jgi:flagellar basal body L-ring protein FlgH